MKTRSRGVMERRRKLEDLDCGVGSRGTQCVCENRLETDMSVINDAPAVQINLDEIQQDLPAYLQRAQAGATFVIVKAGQPLAEIRPVVSTAKYLRPFGLCVGEFSVPDDFDEPLPEQVLQEFEGR